MNEIIFFCHILVVLFFLFVCLARGKEALSAFIVLGAVFANFFVTKQMEFFGFTITCSDIYMVQTILGLNLLQEYYGKSISKKIVQVSFLLMVFFIFTSQIHLFYAPSSQDHTQEAFQTILGMVPRIVFASIFVFFCVQRLDIWFFGLLKKIFQGKYLPLRIGISLIITQMIDTVFFSFLGLYGIVSSILDIIVVSFLVKLCIILFSSPITALSKRFVLNRELVNE